MYGKHFASAYTGSMMGAGADVFAVWGYVIANTAGGQVELNPSYVGLLVGMSPDAVTRAIEYLCAPDPRSRSKADDGRRLVREGEFAYRVPTWEAYRRVRNEDERREYNRLKQREHRAKSTKSERVKASVNDGQNGQRRSTKSTMSAHAEAEGEAKAEAKEKPSASFDAAPYIDAFRQHVGTPKAGRIAEAVHDCDREVGPEKALALWVRWCQSDKTDFGPQWFGQNWKKGIRSTTVKIVGANGEPTPEVLAAAMGRTIR